MSSVQSRVVLGGFGLHTKEGVHQALEAGPGRRIGQRLHEPVDFLLNDGFPRFTLPVLKLVTPHMRRGAVALCGNAALFPADHVDYVSWVRDPENGFRSMRLPMKLAGEFSVRA